MRPRNPHLIWRHPNTSPDSTRRLPYLIREPSIPASNAAWIRFRDKTLLPMIAHRPEDPDLSNFLTCVKEVLDWRATIAPEDRFWRED